MQGEVVEKSRVVLRKVEERGYFGRAMALLKLESADGPVYFVVEGLVSDEDVKEQQKHARYFYEEHSCPTNWIDQTAAVIHNGDADPHGFLEFVRIVEVPEGKDFSDDNEWAILFPEAFEAPLIEGEKVQGAGASFSNPFG